MFQMIPKPGTYWNVICIILRHYIIVRKTILWPQKACLLINRCFATTQSFGQKHIEPRKLVPNLRDKTRYVLYYRNLKLYFRTQTCENTSSAFFQQQPWMKSYIDYNTQKLKEAKNEFENGFYELKINACFGKTMESAQQMERGSVF